MTELQSNSVSKYPTKLNNLDDILWHCFKQTYPKSWLSNHGEKLKRSDKKNNVVAKT